MDHFLCNIFIYRQTRLHIKKNGPIDRIKIKSFLMYSRSLWVIEKVILNIANLRHAVVPHDWNYLKTFSTYICILPSWKNLLVSNSLSKIDQDVFSAIWTHIKCFVIWCNEFFVTFFAFSSCRELSDKIFSLSGPKISPISRMNKSRLCI